MEHRQTGLFIMISDWKEFLANAGAEFTDAGVVHYGNERRELSVAITGNVFADLSHYGTASSAACATPKAACSPLSVPSTAVTAIICACPPAW
jgi:hypothetical protein